MQVLDSDDNLRNEELGSDLVDSDSLGDVLGQIAVGAVVGDEVEILDGLRADGELGREKYLERVVHVDQEGTVGIPEDLVLAECVLEVAVLHEFLLGLLLKGVGFASLPEASLVDVAERALADELKDLKVPDADYVLVLLAQRNPAFERIVILPLAAL